MGVDDAGPAGAVMAAAGAVFQVAAFLPVSAVYTAKDAARRMQILRDHPGQWRAQSALFAAASLALPVGVGMLTRSLAGDRDPRGSAGAGAAAAGAGAGAAAAGAATAAFSAAAPFLLVDLVDRVRCPERFARGDGAGWPFTTFTGLSLAGTALVGVALRRAGAPRWLAWTSTGSAGGLAAVRVATGDLPPASFYAVALVTGATLWRRAGAALGRATPSS